MLQGASSTVPYNNPQNLPLVADFCGLIEQPSQSPVGFCIDGTGGLRAYTCPNTAISYTDRTETLESLLSASVLERPPLEEQYSLAITLAASVFQLSHTPWLDLKLSKKDIAFLRAYNTPPLVVDIRYPYLKRDFAPSKS